MRRRLWFLVLLAAAVDLYALTPQQQEDGADPPTVPRTTQKDKDESVGQGTTAPAPTFSPPEKIEADSAVSFPVDI